jgi:hypothetical protein
VPVESENEAQEVSKVLTPSADEEQKITSIVMQIFVISTRAFENFFVGC